MKRIILLVSVIVLLTACGSYDNGELIGVQNRPMWNPTDPYGMVFIPQGSYVMGPSDQDVPFANVSQSKTVSVGAFYMDETEITNNEYRQFTNWVKDSILRQYLLEVNAEYYGTEVIEFHDGTPTGDYKINWNKKIRRNDEEVRLILDEQMFVPEGERLDGMRQIDARELIYKYQVLKIQEAAVKANREATKRKNNWDLPIGARDRTSFLDDIEVKIYPDTLTWDHDYAYSFNEPYTKNYFWHPAFDDYPVVGVSWKQANAFAHWRTKMMNTFLRKSKQPTLPDFRLPTESEWEYASRGGYKSSPYPWGGPYTRNIQGCFLANFKPLRGNYTQDGGLKAIKTASYNPNEYGLYDMAGNVAEWTSNTYDESGFSYSHDMNMDYSAVAKDDAPDVEKRKVIRGGSWKDVAFFIQTSSRTFEYQDTSKCYIGFRCAIDFLGRDKKDFE